MPEAHGATITAAAAATYTATVLLIPEHGRRQHAVLFRCAGGGTAAGTGPCGGCSRLLGQDDGDGCTELSWRRCGGTMYKLCFFFRQYRLGNVGLDPFGPTRSK